MPSLVLITTKSDADIPWITKSNTDFTYISESDYQNNVAPYWNHIKGLTGYKSIESATSNNISVVMVSFDTYENANSASVQLSDETNNIIKNKNDVYKAAMEKLGVANNYASAQRIV
jgi:type III secretory pathway lipoprotein EscJ